MKYFIILLITSVYGNGIPTIHAATTDGTALSIFFIFFFLGIGSFIKEINKKIGVNNYLI